jgi:hypothetical protein
VLANKFDMGLANILANCGRLFKVRDTGIGTGFFRDGFCSTGPTDEGRHTVCIECTTEFLSFCTAVGNDLSTAIPQYEFPGLMVGDQW